ncbi:MAG: ANTAR domain-containing protein [Candidatus Nanopelagicales bacterium]
MHERRSVPPAESALADTLAALRDEVDGLRAAARLRAVIEQAKGVLVERHHISLDEAFDRLRVMSQEHNVRLVEVAATVVGVSAPEAPDLVVPTDALRSRVPQSPAASPGWTSLQAQPDVRAGVSNALLDAVAGATSHGDEAAQLVCDLLASEHPAAVTLYRVCADESLRLVGQSGVAGDVISSWRSIPPSRDIPYVLSVLDNQALFWASSAELVAQFHNVESMRSTFEAVATVPIVDAGSVVGVAGLMWSEVEDFPKQRADSITRTVQRVAPILLRNAESTDPELEWLDTLLRLHLDPWLLLESVPSADGALGDFVVKNAADQVSGSSEWLGRRLLEIWPFLAQDGTSEALAGLIRAGGYWTTTVGSGSPAPWGSSGSRIRAVRLGGRIVVVWRPGRVVDRRVGLSGELHDEQSDEQGGLTA